MRSLARATKVATRPLRHIETMKDAPRVVCQTHSLWMLLTPKCSKHEVNSPAAISSSVTQPSSSLVEAAKDARVSLTHGRGCACWSCSRSRGMFISREDDHLPDSMIFEDVSATGYPIHESSYVVSIANIIEADTTNLNLLGLR